MRWGAVAVVLVGMLAGCVAPFAASRAVHSTSQPAAPPDLTVAPADWRITDPGPEHAIEGYADRVSLHPGEPVRLFVSTASPTWTVTAFRIGAYPGTGGARIWASPPQSGGVQPAPVVQEPR